MKCTVNISSDREDEIQIFCKEKTKLIEKIIALAEEDSLEITGICNDRTKILDLSDIFFFVTENNRVYAVTEKERWALRQRLYKIEETLPSSFVKINQSCIANINKIDCFRSSFAGAMEVIFKNGETDYVSRRQLKKIKERLGL